MKGKTFFALFAVALMMLSAGVVLCSDQGVAEENAQEITDEQIKITANDTGGLECELAHVKGSTTKTLSGVTWDNDHTLTLDGANFKSTVDKGAINVASDVDGLIIMVKNENRIEFGNAVSETINVGIYFAFSLTSHIITIIGNDPYVDKLSLSSIEKVGKDCYGISAPGGFDVSIKNITLDIKCGNSDNGTIGGINTSQMSESGIVNCVVKVTTGNTIGGEKSTTGIAIGFIEKSTVIAKSGNSQSGGSVAVNIIDHIKDCPYIEAISGNSTGENLFKSSGLTIQSVSKDCTISNSTIYAEAGSVKGGAGVPSIGLCVMPMSHNVGISNSIITALGETAAMAKEPSTSQLDVSIFTDHPLVKGWDSEREEYVYIEEGPISLDYKCVKTTYNRSVTYDLNGGTGTKVTDIVEQGDVYKIRDLDPTMKGFKFVGWSDGKTIYKPGDTIEIGWEDITLTAVWEPVPVPPSGGSSIAIPVAVALVALLFAFFLIIGLVMRRRDEDEE